MNSLENSESLKNISYKRAADFIEDVKKEVNERGVAPTYSTGIKTLDDTIWGLHKKELLIIAARPSHGKTSLSLQIAWNVAKKGFSCVFISLEMSGQAIFERLICNETWIDGWLLRKGDAQERKKFNEVIDTFERVSMCSSFEVFDQNGKNEQEVEEIIKSMQPDFIFIDHVQMITPSGFSSKQEAIASYVRFCKKAAIAYNCGIILNSQINRMGSGMDNSINFLKGSGELEEGADTVIQCRWLIKENPDENRNDYEVRILKQRHGPTDLLLLHFNPDSYIFKDRELNHE